MKNIFLLLGMSGSGKTTSSEELVNNNNCIEAYSIGNILRVMAKYDAKLAKYVSSGKRVPLEMVSEIINEIIKNIQKNIVIIDGYPRDIKQAKLIDAIIKNHGMILSGVFEIDINKKIAKDRVLNRARGEDDTSQVFDNRLKDYKEKMMTIRKYWEEIIVPINGNNSVENVSKMIEAKILDLIK